MKTCEFVIETLNCIFEACIIVFYLFLVMKKDYRYPLKFLAIPAVIFFSAIEAMTITQVNPWVKLIVILALMMITAYIMFESRVRSILFYCLMFIVVALASEIMPVIALNLMNLGTDNNNFSTGTGRYICMACSKLFSFWFAIYIAEYLKPKQREIPFRNWLLIIFVPLLSLIILNSIFISTELSPRRSLLYLLSVGGIFILNIFVFDFFDTYSNTIKLQLMEQRLKSEEENYRLIEEKYTEIRQLKHDISNQLAAARRLFMQGSGPEAASHLNRLYSKLSAASGVCYTGISSVDAIVNMKWHTALSNNIPFSCKVMVPEKMKIDELPLCRIIANLLDNAIEGVQRSSAEEKFVYISIIQNNKKLRICVMNSSDEVDADNLKTKKTGYGHGIGVSSVREAVDQLDGILSFNWENGIFTADIMLAY
ncbi:sensor histidine kinase [Ruminococcus flavefaciens]|uniref:sensor histidine kinase n=1 Tax=Ruminococcus flavefaciens TaxID=1265 RepID=UPI0026EA5428|nr:sensor histidine kinase [Ruminococcus flavefaciens]MDD7515503.1 GHKL domain-containing protein [Ruminococcus flavefaciens]MDY5690196.1 GHKL domain-containing protein [Ruminococcus flavefaciens]